MNASSQTKASIRSTDFPLRVLFFTIRVASPAQGGDVGAVHKKAGRQRPKPVAQKKKPRTGERGFWVPFGGNRMMGEGTPITVTTHNT